MQAWCHCGWAYKTHQFLIKIVSKETVLTKSSKHWVELEFIKHLHEQSYILYEYMLYLYTYCTFYCSIFYPSIFRGWRSKSLELPQFFNKTRSLPLPKMNKQFLLLEAKQIEWPTNATRPQKRQVDWVSFFGCDMVGSCFQKRLMFSLTKNIKKHIELLDIMSIKWLILMYNMPELSDSTTVKPKKQQKNTLRMHNTLSN